MISNLSKGMAVLYNSKLVQETNYGNIEQSPGFSEQPTLKSLINSLKIYFALIEDFHERRKTFISLDRFIYC